MSSSSLPSLPPPSGGFGGFAVPQEADGQPLPDLLSAREPCSTDNKQEEKKQQQQQAKKKQRRKNAAMPRFDASKPLSCRSATFGEIALAFLCLGMFVLYTSEVNNAMYTVKSMRTELEVVKNDLRRVHKEHEATQSHVTQLTKEVEVLLQQCDSNVLARTTDPAETKDANLCEFLLSQFHRGQEGATVLDGRKRATSSGTL